MDRPLRRSLAASACGTEPAERAPARPDLPNVMFVTIDTLRPDHLEPYGYDQQTAPYIHSLGREGAVFTLAFSTSSWTAPTTASLFTGRHPAIHGVTMGIRAHRRMAKEVERDGVVELELNRIPDELTVMPELLRSAGYTTFGISTNLNVGEEMGLDRGFDRMEVDNMSSIEEVRAQLDRWLAEIAESEPWFVYLHLIDVHTPYEGRSPWYEPAGDERADVIASYDSESGTWTTRCAS